MLSEIRFFLSLRSPESLQGDVAICDEELDCFAYARNDVVH